MWFIKHIICSSETMIFNMIYKRGNLQSHLITISYFDEARLWLSKRINVKAWHPGCQLRFFRGRCKTQHNTCPLTVQHYTTTEKKSFEVGSTQFLTSIFLLYFFRSHANLHMVFIFQNKCFNFFPSSLATTLQKQTWRMTYRGKTILAKYIVQKAASSKSTKLKLIWEQCKKLQTTMKL